MGTESTEFGPVGTNYGSAGSWDNWTVYASSGEHGVPAESLGHALLRFVERHPDDFVHAIVCDGMEPPLTIAETPEPVVSTAATVTEILSAYADFEHISSEDVCGVPVSAVFRDAETDQHFRIIISKVNEGEES